MPDVGYDVHQDQYNPGGRQGAGRQVRGGDAGGRATQNVPGEEWEVVQPTKKGQQRGMVDEKRVQSPPS